MENFDLLAAYREIALLNTINAQLHWDMEVNLPTKSLDLRSQQLVFLSQDIQKRTQNPDFLNALNDPTTIAKLSTHQVRNLRNFVYAKAALTPELDKKLVETENKAVDLWQTAKKNNDFASVTEILKELIALRKQACAQKRAFPPLHAELQNLSDYDIMIGVPEPGLKSSDVAELLLPLKDGLIERVRKLKSATTPEPKPLESISIDIKELLTQFGFDLEKGRIDYIESYPFCSGGQGDTRITTRKHGDAIDNLLTTLHEMGHGLYEQGLPEDIRLTPSGAAVSTGFHESQSRFYENQIGRSSAFIKYLSKKTGTSQEILKQHLTQITPGAIRTSADEVHYNLHIIIRWEIEQDLVSGKLEVSDIPKVWNAKMKEYLGVTVTSDTEGCLQDLHWFMSDFGWLPTYTIGNIIAAQFYAGMKKEYPDWEQRIENGDFLFIKTYLSRLHHLAATEDFNGTVLKLFGGKLSAQHLLDYLDERYL